MSVNLYKIGEVRYRLLGTNAFHVKAKNEGFTAAGRVVVRTSKMKISRRHLADYVKKLHQKRAARAARLFFPHSTNQIIHLWRCRCRRCRHFLNSLISRIRTVNATSASTWSATLGCPNARVYLTVLAFVLDMWISLALALAFASHVWTNG